MERKRKRWLSIGLVVSLFLLVGFGAALVALLTYNSLSEDSTVRYSAEVASVQFTENGSSTYVCIRTDSPERNLYIEANIAKRIDLSLVRGLKPGESITCQVVHDTAKKVDSPDTAVIVALQIGDDVIYSLTDRNALMKESARPTVIAACVLICVLACFAVGSGSALYRHKRKSV